MDNHPDELSNPLHNLENTPEMGSKIFSTNSPSGYTSIQDLRFQIQYNARFVYRGAYTNFIIITGEGKPLNTPTNPARLHRLAGSRDSGVFFVQKRQISPIGASVISDSADNDGHLSEDGQSSIPNGDLPQPLATTDDNVVEPTRIVSSTWAALVSRQPPTADRLIYGNERVLLRSRDCKTELEAIASLHALLKEEVTKRISLLDDHCITLDAAAASADALLRLRPGMALKVNERGMVYVLDHVDKTSHWQLPGYEPVKALKEVVSKARQEQAAADEAGRSIPFPTHVPLNAQTEGKEAESDCSIGDRA